QEEPGLIEDDGGGEHKAERHRRVQRDAELVAGMREEEFAVGQHELPVTVTHSEDRFGKPPYEIVVQRHPEAAPDAHKNRSERIDDAPTQLLEVIEERHLSAVRLRNWHPGSLPVAVAQKSLHERRSVGGRILVEYPVEDTARLLLLVRVPQERA